jgi:hypothetical protein
MLGESGAALRARAPRSPLVDTWTEHTAASAASAGSWPSSPSAGRTANPASATAVTPLKEYAPSADASAMAPTATEPAEPSSATPAVPGLRVDASTADATRKPQSPPGRSAPSATPGVEDQFRRFLTDASLPLELRIVGALIRLYGLPLFRIVHLTTDGFHQGERGAHFTFDENPVLLPPTLARLSEQQITTGPSRAALGPLASSEHPELLLPDHPASRPRSSEALSGQLMKHGLPTIAVRNTALFGMAGEPPPIIMSDLFGVHRNTATQWAALAQDSWAGYLAGLRVTDDSVVV